MRFDYHTIMGDIDVQLLTVIEYVLRDLARFQPATLLKETILRGCFSLFLICANGTKLRKACHMNDHTFD